MFESIVIIMLCAEKTFSIVEKAIMLETKYGPPEGYPPLLDYVLSYLKEVVYIYYEYFINIYSIVFCISSFFSSILTYLFIFNEYFKDTSIVFSAL